MSNSARKSCTRCKHVNCTCRGSGGGDSVDGDNTEEVGDGTRALSSSPSNPGLASCLARARVCFVAMPTAAAYS